GILYSSWFGLRRLRERSSALAPQNDLNTGRKSGKQAAGNWVLNKFDLDWNTLHDTDEIASRIVSGQETEGRSATRCKTVNFSLDNYAGIGVDRYLGRLTGLNILNLCLLEICDNPNVLDWHQIDQGSSGGYQASDANLTVTNNTIKGSTDDCIVEINSGQVTRSPGLKHSSQGSFLLCGENLDTCFLCLQRGLCA